MSWGVFRGPRAPPSWVEDPGRGVKQGGALDASGTCSQLTKLLGGDGTVTILVEQGEGLLELSDLGGEESGVGWVGRGEKEVREAQGRVPRMGTQCG